MTPEEKRQRLHRGRYLFALVRAGMNVQQYLEDALRLLDLAPLEVQILRELSLAPSPSTSLVAHHLGMMRQALARPLRKLERARLIELGASVADRRRAPLRLTVTGEERLEQALNIIVGAEQRFMGNDGDTSEFDVWLCERVWELRPKHRPPRLCQLLRRTR